MDIDFPRDHQPRRLAVSPLRCELSRCRRSLAQRGITVSYEAIRLWCLTVGSVYARRLKRRQGRLGDIWHLDEVFVTIQGQRRYLWRAVDQDGDVLDILVQSRRDRVEGKNADGTNPFCLRCIAYSRGVRDRRSARCSDSRVSRHISPVS